MLNFKLNDKKELKQYTLFFAHQQGKILLGHKKRGFAKGKWNGFGGKVEATESVIEACLREVQEEAGIKPLNPELVGYFTFEIEGIDHIFEVFVYKSDQFEGEITESEEMKPEWFDINEIPYEKMWKDDQVWYKSMLRNRNFQGHFKFNRNEEISYYNFLELSKDQFQRLVDSKAQPNNEITL